MPEIRVENLTKKFKDVVAVDDLTFSFPEGKVTCLLGPSGCGKTTLGKLLIRLLEPTTGEIIFNGKNIATLNPGELRSLRKSMQIIFQDPYNSLNPRLTAGDAILEPMKFHGLFGKRP